MLRGAFIVHLHSHHATVIASRWSKGGTLAFTCLTAVLYANVLRLLD
jgi:hypothetical protein